MAIRALSSAREATSAGSGDTPLDVDGAHIGSRVRELRKAHGRTLSDVASAVGISVSYLSQIERDVSRLPIGMLKKIADELGVHMNWFFHSAAPGPEDERDVVVRAANRRNLTFTGLGITEELLSPNLSGPLEVLISTIHPGADSEYYTHEGAEAGLVMEGTLDLWVGERHFVLGKGDSFAFPSTDPHRCLNRGTRPVKVLWVITPPHY
ncbi:MAG: helix-turn-helix domain-containing protein [Ilumatobacteraceae bacterium]|jgi:transcriptional regulator with XRE-family HTH domain